MPLKEEGLEPNDMEVEQFPKNSRDWNKNLKSSMSTCPKDEKIDKGNRYEIDESLAGRKLLSCLVMFSQRTEKQDYFLQFVKDGTRKSESLG